MARNGVKTPMAIKEIVVTGESGRDYTIGVAGDGSAYCSCPAWRNTAGRTASERICKHITFVTGKMAEHFARVNGIEV